MRELCADCNGACCRNVRVVAKHLTADQAQWAELHGALRGDQWYIAAKCSALDDAGRCTIYHARPHVCRDYMPAGRDCLAAREVVGL